MVVRMERSRDTTSPRRNVTLPLTLTPLPLAWDVHKDLLTKNMMKMGN
jgi:hypothetical protein